MALRHVAHEVDDGIANHRAVLCMPCAGHMVPYVQPQRAFELISRFISGQLPDPAA